MLRVALLAGESADPIEFAVEYEHRASGSFDRLQVINTFVNPIPQPPHKVNLTKGSKTIIVQIMRNVCVCCVAAQYRQLAKFNMRKVAEPPEGAAAAAAPQAGKGQDSAAKASDKQPAAGASTEQTAAKPEGQA